MKTLKNNLLLSIPAALLLSLTSPANAQTNPETAPLEQAPADTLQQTVATMFNDLQSLKKLKITGLVQAQFQIADSVGIASYAGGDFPKAEDKRFALRRGRLKASYTAKNSVYVLQIDANETGAVTLKDAYFKYTEPYLQMFSLTGGVFIRPFGFELLYSSSDRESPERGRMSQIIFAGERDMGFMLTIQPPKTSPLNILKLEAGLFNGPGLGAREFDKKKDLTTRLSVNKASKNEKVKYGLGVSYFNGGYRQDNDSLFEMTSANDTSRFILTETERAGEYTTRQYYGADAQISFDWIAGITTIRAEYIMGDQPGLAKDIKNPAAAVAAPIYARKFNGAYFYFLQNIAQSKAQIVVKYDWFDPNTDVETDEIGKTGTNLSAADIKYSTLGFGLLWRFDSNLKASAYYDLVQNEKTQLAGYTDDLKDNVFTLRLQYRF